MLLTTEEFTNLWRRHRGYAQLRDDASLGRADGLNLDLLLREQAEAWYDALLRRGPKEAVPLTDIASELSLIGGVEPGVTLAELPEGVVRVESLRLIGHAGEAFILPEGSPAALRCRNRYARLGAGGGGIVTVGSRMLTIYFAAEGTKTMARPEYCMAVKLPPEGFVEINPCALELLRTRGEFDEQSSLI